MQFIQGLVISFFITFFLYQIIEGKLSDKRKKMSGYSMLFIFFLLLYLFNGL
ncbi:hypothetical protein SAMN04488577_2098 [Bacillus sp. cl95]|nr:hypothetical protein SAMN02799634_103467 [Bacillus sp. UNCCL13]SFQ81780.1 hypothetical protein SAMN04488577_2098 [Bacillus sp. cl95]